MQALSEQLQNRIDEFHHRYGQGAELDERNVYAVRNLSKPKHEQHDVIVQGSLIDRFIFNGFYSIDLIGQFEQKSTADSIKHNREKTQEQSSKAVEELRAALSPDPVKKAIKEKTA